MLVFPRSRALCVARVALAVGSGALSVVAGAQQPDPAEMERMMQAGMQMAECMEKADPVEMQAMEALGERMEAEVTALCQAGKRDAAQARAIELGTEMGKSPAMAVMKDCGQMAAGMFQGSRMMNPDHKDHHVCDVP